MIIAALTLEGGARLFLFANGPGDAPIAVGWTPNAGESRTFRDLVYVSDPRIFFRLAPNLDIESTSNPRIFDLQTDSRGMRSPEPILPKPPRSYRVLAAGDSCTFGSGAGQTGTYPMQLQQYLRGARKQPHFEVLNAGVPGFTSFQALELLEMEGFALSPDMVIFATGYNDASPATAGIKRPFGSDRMQSDQQYADAIRRSRALGITRLLWRAGLLTDDEEADSEENPREKHRVSVREYGSNLRAFVESSRSLGVTPVLVIWPRRSQVDALRKLEAANQLMARYHDEVRRVGSSMDATVVDLTAILRNRQDIFVDIIHLNARGYGFVAEALTKIVLADADRRAASGRQ